MAYCHFCWIPLATGSHKVSPHTRVREIDFWWDELQVHVAKGMGTGRDFASSLLHLPTPLFQFLLSPDLFLMPHDSELCVFLHLNLTSLYISFNQQCNNRNSASYGIKYLLYTGHHSKSSMCRKPFNSHFLGKYYFLDFIVDETKTQWGSVTCPKAQLFCMVKSGFQPRTIRVQPSVSQHCQ